MLTPEERERIEEEEGKRLAEEKYRAAVRRKLRAEEAPEKRPSRIPWIVGIGAVLIIGALLVTNTRSQIRPGDDGTPTAQAASRPDPIPKIRYVPVSQKIATGQIVVKANGYVQYRLTIAPEMREATITGNFNASGGSGNDVQAVIADEMNFTNWVNGHQAKIFWGTEGKQTTGTIDVGLPPGLYYLVFSNKFSAFTDKQVFLEVDLSYKKAETYY